MTDGRRGRAELDVLRRVLLRLRSEEQGGFRGYRGHGQWEFASVALEVTQPELNALLRLAGVIPTPIIPRGECRTCRHAEGGRDRGTRAPCGGCRRPRMTRWAPKETT